MKLTLIIEGVRGAGKTRLMTHIIGTLRNGDEYTVNMPTLVEVPTHGAGIVERYEIEVELK